MGGRIAEEACLQYEAITTGASSDLQNVAQLSKEMVVEEGMGKQTRNLSSSRRAKLAIILSPLENLTPKNC